MGETAARAGIKRIGHELTGKRVTVGATFDPGPEFAKRHLVHKFDQTEIGKLLTDVGLVPEMEDTRASGRKDDAIA